MQRCSNMVEKEAARTSLSEENPMKLCITTESSEAVPIGSKGKKASIDPASASGVAEGVPEVENNASVGATAAALEGGKEENLTRLSQQYVDDVLAWKPDPIEDPDEYYNRMINDPLKCFSQEYIDKSTESLRILAEITERNNAKFKQFQDWVRAEYEEKNYVEVDDYFIAHRVLQSLTVEDEDFDPDLFLSTGAIKKGEGVAIESN